MTNRMSVIGVTASLLAAASLLGACAQTGQIPKLVWTAQPHMDFSLGPRLAGPGVDRINSRLAALDERVQVQHQECMSAAGEVGSWIRTVWTPYLGPRFLTVAVSDQRNCGGPYPFGEINYYTFDRATDDLLDWSALWPGVSIRATRPEAGTTAARTGAPALRRWYVDAVMRDPQIDPELRGLCAGRLAPEDDGEDIAIWLEGASGGLGMKLTDLPHAARVCGFVQIMPAAEMARLGASDALLRAVRAAPAAFDYSEMPR
jgi:hypothetical protein